MIIEKQTETASLAWIWLLLGIVLMTLLTWFNGRPEAAGLLHMHWDKVAHSLIFGGITLSFGLSARGRRRGWIFLLMIAFAAFDELRQRYLPGRSASIADFTTDALAIITVLWVILPWLLHEQRRQK